MDRALQDHDVAERPIGGLAFGASRGAAEREAATAKLHELLLRAARFELGRRRAALSHVRGEELDDIAMQAANDALMAVLASSMISAAPAASQPGPTSSPCSRLE